MSRDPDLIHWHKVGDEPSNCQLPPECCIDAFDKVTARVRDDAEHAERRRVVTESLAEVERYANALASVLVGEQAELATKVMNHVVEAIRSAGCICPMIDITALNEPPGSRKIPGGDSRCGVHGRRP
jgi:hypothetical protein